MIIIHVTQCASQLHESIHARIAHHMPVEYRLRYYERKLTEWSDSKYDVCPIEIRTYDELLIIVVQYFVRKGILKHVVIKSYCECNQKDGKVDVRECVLDEEGDFTNDMHHGFFHQRLKYLR